MIKTEIKQTTTATTTWRLELGLDEVRDLLISAGVLPKGVSVELSYYDSEQYVEPLRSEIIVHATFSETVEAVPAERQVGLAVEEAQAPETPTLVLNKEDSAAFVDALMNPRPPNERLKQAMARRKELVQDKETQP